ncbi:hypothetical protein STENM223S_05895 [Streptomyces tendae]
MVSAPECSSTIRGARRSPRTSQKRRPKARAPVSQRFMAASSEASGSRPQWSKSRRSM